MVCDCLDHCSLHNESLLTGICRVEEVETPQLLDAWVKTLDLIEALSPKTIIPGHLEEGWKLDAKADLEHCRKYLDLFGEKVTYARTKPQVDDLFETFKDAFPHVSSDTIQR